MNSNSQTAPSSASSASSNSIKIASTLDIYFLGITIVLGSCAISWNAGLEAQFIEFLTSTLLIGTGYLMLTLCVAEMVSALPFSGGLYGLARVTLTPFVGFLVGCSEMIHNIFYVAATTMQLSRAISQSTHADSRYEPIYWLIFLSLACMGNSLGGHVFWNTTRVLAVFCFVVIFLYFITPIVNPVHFEKYALTNFDHVTDRSYNIAELFRHTPLATWWFIGIELMPFACTETATPTKSLPYGMIACMITVIVLDVLIYFTACSQAPGIIYLYDDLLPLSYGLSKLFHISKEAANIFSIPMVFATVFGFMYGGGRQIWSLSSSGLLPAVLKKRTEGTSAPYAALIFESIASFIAMLIVKYLLDDQDVLLFYIYILGSAFVYVTILVTYVVFKSKYPTLKREFVNPLGVFGAVLGIFIFTILFGSATGMQEEADAIISPISFGILLFVGFVYYFSYASKKQYYSEEEQKAFLVTYVINSNRMGRKKLSGPNSNRSNQSSSRSAHTARSANKSLHRQNSRSYHNSTQQELSVSINVRKLANKEVVDTLKAEVKGNNNNDSMSVNSSNDEEPLGAFVNRPVDLQNMEPIEELGVLSQDGAIDFQQLPSTDELFHIKRELELNAPLEPNLNKPKEEQSFHIPSKTQFFDAIHKIVPHLEPQLGHNIGNKYQESDQNNNNQLNSQSIKEIV